MRSNGTCAKAVQQEKETAPEASWPASLQRQKMDQVVEVSRRKGRNHRQASEFPREVFSNRGVRACENCKRCLAGPSTESRKSYLRSGGCREWWPEPSRAGDGYLHEEKILWNGLAGFCKVSRSRADRGGLLHRKFRPVAGAFAVQDVASEQPLRA